jgi:carbamoylphosphate synthase large subunit
VDSICRICRERDLDVFLPSCREVFQLAPHAARLREETAYPFAAKPLLEMVNDKHRLAELAGAVGVKTPRATAVCTGTEPLLPEGAGYPVIVKPLSGYGAKGCTVARNAAELRAAVAETATDCLIQEYVRGRLLVWSGIRWRGALRASFAFEALKTSPAVNGYSVLRRSTSIPELDEQAMRILDRAGYEGFCTLDFIRDRDSGTFT